MHHEIAESLIVAGVFVVGLFCAFYWWADYQARKEVQRTPKIPMHECPVHGVYPAKYTLQLEVPVDDDSKPPLLVETCIFCYEEKMKAAEKIFKT